MEVSTAMLVFRHGSSDDALQPYGLSLASGLIGTPALHDLEADSRKRWSYGNFFTRNFARLYHSCLFQVRQICILALITTRRLDCHLDSLTAGTTSMSPYPPARTPATLMMQPRVLSYLFSELVGQRMR
ncbi:hypothetical protein ARMGADRAFT_1133648 [Armillaria gallica]|uniref:Uncharacterized protein n=1 Tax=Armillaria gallica TaxID=47427 RepID=A0A2H3D6C5_ARMGA|nr:hypothetical protein ARMGADRAFT_1133648 [Armillaria gallica]